MDRILQNIIDRLCKAGGDTRVLTNEERDYFLCMIAQAREGIEYKPEFDFVLYMKQKGVMPVSK